MYQNFKLQLCYINNINKNFFFKLSFDAGLGSLKTPSDKIVFVFVQAKYPKGEHWVCAIRDGKIKRYCKCDYFDVNSVFATTTTTSITNVDSINVSTTTDESLIPACEPSISFPSEGEEFFVNYDKLQDPTSGSVNWIELVFVF